VVPLDNFYFDQDRPGLPQRFGIVDWDDPGTWDSVSALATLTSLCTTGQAEMPDYDIPISTRVGSHEISLGDATIVIAEGVFAGELVAPCQQAGLLAQAICLRRRRLITFTFRLIRDLSEARKPVPTLIRRGIGLYREEPELIAKWVAQGCEPMGLRTAETTISALARRPDAN